MLTTFYPPYHFGGDAVYVQALSEGLAKLGHEVHVVHCADAFRIRGKPPASADYHSKNLFVHRLRSKAGILSPLISQQTGRPGLKSAKLRKILDLPFDVIHFHNISLIGGPGVLNMGKAPVKLYTLHEYWLICPTHVFWKNRSHVCDKPTCFSCSLRSGIPPQLWRYTGLRDRSLTEVDLLLSPSEYTARRHADAGISAPIRVLPLFSAVDPGPGTTTVKPTDRPTFVCVGRVTRSKGIRELVEQFAAMPEFDLLVAGTGDDLDALRAEFGAYSNIQFLGHVPQSEISRVYARATAAILPSLVPETFGLAVVEALACSAPVIVKRSGGGPEIVHRSQAGYVYENSEQLQSIVRELASDRDRVELLRGRARRAFDQFFTLERHLNDYLSIVRDIGNAKLGQGTNGDPASRLRASSVP